MNTSRDDASVKAFAEHLAAIEDRTEREAVIKRARMLALNEVKPEAFEAPALLSPNELAAARQREYDAAVALIEEHGYSDHIERLADSDANAIAARRVIADELTSRLGMDDADAKALITRIATEPEPIALVTAEEFMAAEEAGSKALLGTDDQAVIAEDGDAMFYGDGGAGKTTLTTDLGFHLAAGDDWLGMPVARALRVLVIENEGPRPMFRRKLARKREAWEGSPLEGRLTVFERPWGEFSFANSTWRERLAAVVSEQAIDVLIAGPLTRLGMDDAGTLQQTRDFMALVGEVRAKAKRPLATVLVHHDNKAGSVSGAWEGAGDTLLHMATHAHGRSDLKVQKARWASDYHGRVLKLDWTEGEGYALVDDRNYLGEIEALLADGIARTASEIGHKRTHDELPGIGAKTATVKQHLENGLTLGALVKLEGDDAADYRDKVASNGVYYLLDPSQNQAGKAV